ncbi:MAG TPA: FlgD immunoglobulin-like domain containing protein, partial [Bacteroidales bacterium]|nr:FlgD immunoglobulin-like domain containing protein [Bacteroidales bacterium]
ATIDFEVVASSGFKLENLRNYPNPFTESTYFVFNHNQSGEVLSIEIQIYNSTGHIVRTLITEDEYNSGYQSQAVYWDGKTENGQTLPKGLYLYRVIVKNADGLKAIQSARLIRI